MRLNNTVLRPHLSNYFGAGGHSIRRLYQTPSGVHGRFQYQSSNDSHPEGTEPPFSYFPARIGGSLSSYGKVSGSGDIIAHLGLGKALSSTLTGSGTISAASLSLIVQLAATMAANGEISAAQLQAISSLAATLSGSGTISAAQMGAIVQMAATLAGNGTISAATMKGILSMSASLTVSDVSGIVVVGAASKQEIAQEVLTSQIADYSAPGNVAEGIENASSAGNPWSAPLSSNNTPGTFGAFVQKLLTIGKFLGLKG